MKFIRVLKSSLPNENSLGEPISNNPQVLQNFWNWFNGSKVVDKQGRPLVVYHGTTKEFEEFSKDMIGTSTDRGFYGTGFYFTTSRSCAKSYGNKILSCYLKIKNPFYFDWIAYPFKFGLNKDKLVSLLKDCMPEGYDIDYTLKSISKNEEFIGFIEHPKTFSNTIKQQGYDGIIYLRGKEWIIFEPNQIKSILNNANYNKEDNSIYGGMK